MVTGLTGAAEKGSRASRLVSIISSLTPLVDVVVNAAIVEVVVPMLASSKDTGKVGEAADSPEIRGLRKAKLDGWGVRDTLVIGDAVEWFVVVIGTSSISVDVSSGIVGAPAGKCT